MTQEGLWLRKGLSMCTLGAWEWTGSWWWGFTMALAASLQDASTVRFRWCQMPGPFKLGNSGKERSTRCGMGLYYQQGVTCQGWVLSDHSWPWLLWFDLGPFLPWISSFSLFLYSPVAFLNEQCYSKLSSLLPHVYWRLWQREGGRWLRSRRTEKSGMWSLLHGTLGCCKNVAVLCRWIWRGLRDMPRSEKCQVLEGVSTQYYAIIHGGGHGKS